MHVSERTKEYPFLSTLKYTLQAWLGPACKNFQQRCKSERPFLILMPEDAFNRAFLKQDFCQKRKQARS